MALLKEAHLNWRSEICYSGCWLKTFSVLVKKMQRRLVLYRTGGPGASAFAKREVLNNYLCCWHAPATAPHPLQMLDPFLGSLLENHQKQHQDQLRRNKLEVPKCNLSMQESKSICSADLVKRRPSVGLILWDVSAGKMFCSLDGEMEAAVQVPKISISFIPQVKDAPKSHNHIMNHRYR